MGEATNVQTSFRGGEWSKSMQGRMDLPEYKMALTVCLNGFPTEEERWDRRPGTQHVLRIGREARAIGYTFNEQHPYNLLLSDGVFNFYTGSTLVTTNDDQIVTNISTATPALVTTAAPHGFADNDFVFFNFADVTSPLLHNRLCIIDVTSATQFSISDPVEGEPINGTDIAWTIPTRTVTVSRLLSIASNYGTGLWKNVRAVQSNEDLIFLHNQIAPSILQVETEPTDTIFASFSYDNVIFHDGPYLDPVTNGVTLAATTLTGIVNLTLSAPTWLATTVYSIGTLVTLSNITYQSLTDQNLNNSPDVSPTFWEQVSVGTTLSPDGFATHEIGRMVRMFSEPRDWNAGTNYVTNDVVKYNGAYWAALLGMTGSVPTPGQVNPNQPGIKATTWAPTAGPSVARWTWGRITGFSNAISQALGSVISGGDTLRPTAIADGNNIKLASACAAAAIANSILFLKDGFDFSGSPQTPTKVTLFPSTDKGFGFYTGISTVPNVRIIVYGSNTLPNLAGITHATATGTVLADTGTFANSNQVKAMTISNPNSWKYVWFELQVPRDLAFSGNANAVMAQVRFEAGVTATTNGISVEVLGDDLLYTTPIKTWRLGLYGGLNGFPTCGTYHEGRLWLAGAQDSLRIDSCRANGIDGRTINFAPTEPDGTVTDANAISYTFNSPDRGPIFWMQPDQKGIVCGTLAGEWLVQASANNNILTPTSIQAHRYTKVGCANVEPRRTTLTTIFVQKNQRKLQEFFSDVISGQFTSPNLALAVKHLTKSGIAEIAYQQEPDPIIWMRTNDGRLIGTSYKRESLFSSQGPTMNGWHRHELGSGRKVDFITNGQNEDGTRDLISLVTSDADGIRHVEILSPAPEEDDLITDGLWLDDAINPTFEAVQTINVVQSLVLYGMYPHEGKLVTVTGGGLDLGDWLVSGGVVVIPFGKDPAGLFTVDFWASFQGQMICRAGFTYTSRGQRLPTIAPVEAGARNGPAFGKLQRSHYIIAKLVRTIGVEFGTDFAKMRKAKLKTESGRLVPVTELFDGIHRDTYDDPNSFMSRIAWQVTRPYPCSITAIGAALHSEDI